MSCSGGCCSERLKKSDVDNWTNSVSQMLISEIGRQKFIQFLLDRSLNESMMIVRFWEKCDLILKKIRAERSVPRNEVIIALRELIDFADDSIDFSYNQMEILRRVMNETDTGIMCEILSRAKTSAARLLDEEHKIFSNFILREYQNSCH